MVEVLNKLLTVNPPKSSGLSLELIATSREVGIDDISKNPRWI